ncbi:MAG: SGNH/GDSL hydrolase family protein [Clostridia bacterium]|nr:SGNH/GDSL hydrolase family protein [Clostridia bacterium]
MIKSRKKANIFVRPAAWLCALALLFFSLFSVACGSNSSDFDLDKCIPAETAITGKTFYWLGSSVTLGMESGDVAVADYIAARNGSTCIKEAVSGTTLIDEPYKKFFTSYDSYITRLKTTEAFDRTKKIDAFFCQISTNDAKEEFKDKRGAVTGTDVTDKESFDVKTTVGAMEYIVAYVRETWNCPVYFFSNARFDDTGERKSKNPKGSEYASVVKAAYEVAEKWNAVGADVRIIDLFNDEEFNDISGEDYDFYMHDPVHPYKAGYLKWWTPAFEKILFEDFGSEVQG